MPTYQYQALRMSDQLKVQGTIAADTERHARELLREQEMYPTAVKLLQMSDEVEPSKRTRQVSAFETWMAEKLSRVGMQEKITFTQNLEMMVRAGIPITEALLYMESYMDNPKFKRLVNNIRLDILGGSSFSNALSKHPLIFNDVYVNIVHAGEASGELESVLNRLFHMLDGEAKLRKKVIAALVYPAVVVGIAVLVLILMFTIVLPTFADIYGKMGVKLPMITQVMISISYFITHYWFIALPLVGALGYLLKRYISSPDGRRNLDEVMLKTPVVSPLVIAVSVSHFISTLNVSFAAGLPITDCIYMACKTVNHTTIRQAFDEVNLKIQAGQRLAAAMADTEILPSMVVIMISTGEESGALENMLNHSLDYLEQEVNQRVDVLMSMMEPVLLVVLGFIVGAMALSIYLPLFSMYEHIH